MSSNRWPNRRKVTIRPRSIGPDIYIEAYSELDAAESFCKLIGLEMVSAELSKTTNPPDEVYVSFTIGTGNRFYAFESPVE